MNHSPSLSPPWPNPPRRARSIEEVRARLKHFRPSESEGVADRLRARETDVFIATYPKCGTTLLQQMVHCLRTGGDEDFSEITEVVPWLEMCGVMGVDPDAEQTVNPRAFKTHRPFDRLPHQGKRIHMTRDPITMADSFYRFFADWIFDADAIGRNQFVNEMILEGTRAGNYWDHLAQWWTHRHDANVLMLCYEDFLDAPDRTINQVAAFIGIALTPTLLQTTQRNTGKAYMKAREHQFDDHLVHPIVNLNMGLPLQSSTSKVSGTHQRTEFENETLTALNQRWKDEIADRFGLAHYKDLRMALQEERG